ncbi:hypothetical protein [Candidatus Borrarchaeum sp.]|uniref:hypothetical protein n=1 Tax=Candidatus Borrarchaeum sp. TaxID=2846742 RepID=UPI00257D2242|nr:hypothetical protein [Candidatus Borrarchaeum sp.]
MVIKGEAQTMHQAWQKAFVNLEETIKEREVELKRLQTAKKECQKKLTKANKQTVLELIETRIDYLQKKLESERSMLNSLEPYNS